MPHLLDLTDFFEDQDLSSKHDRVADQEACLLVKQGVQLQELPPAPVLCRLAVPVLRLLGDSPAVATISICLQSQMQHDCKHYDNAADRPYLPDVC